MDRFIYVLLILFSGLLVTHCSDGTTGVDGSSGGEDSTNVDNPEFEVTDTTVFAINTSKTFQTINSFSSSDAWSTEIIGENWPLGKREQAARLLFSKDFDENGNPEGIGLSGWRFHIGAGRGTLENSGYRQGSWYKVQECFLSEDGSYNWNKQKGSQWFLKKANEYGVETIVGFLTSPPYTMTENGYVFRTNDVNGYNLAPDRYDDYADFLATVAKHFENEGMAFDLISPLNEPQYDWEYTAGNASQAGTKASNSEIAEVVRAINNSFEAEGVNETQIMVPEAGALQYLYEGNANGDKDQIDAFWVSSSDDYIGDLSYLSNYVAGHSYWTNHSVSESINTRKTLANKLNSVNPDLEYWQTEYSILGSAFDDAVSNPTSIAKALWITRVIHNDLVYGNATSWSFWTTFSYGRPNKFGLFGWSSNTEDRSSSDGPLTPVKNLWALGNYSRFVRPGMQRVEVENQTYSSDIEAGKNVMASAYTDSETSKLVLVIINYSDENQKIAFSNLNNGFSLKDHWDVYITSEYRNLKHAVYSGDRVKVLSKSITTLVGNI